MEGSEGSTQFLMIGTTEEYFQQAGKQEMAWHFCRVSREQEHILLGQYQRYRQICMHCGDPSRNKNDRFEQVTLTIKPTGDRNWCKALCSVLIKRVNITLAYSISPYERFMFFSMFL